MTITHATSAQSEDWLVESEHSDVVGLSLGFDEVFRCGIGNGDALSKGTGMTDWVDHERIAGSKIGDLPGARVSIPHACTGEAESAASTHRP